MTKNKKFRKHFAVTASAAMLAGAVLPAAVAHAQLDDVSETQASYEAVAALTAEGIIQGYEDNKFHGELTVQRKHAVLFLNRALKLDAPADIAGILADFSDVSEDDARYGAGVATLLDAGIFSGNTDGTFGLEGNLTRQQMATILVRAYGLTGNDTEVTLTDLDKVSKHHVADVKVLFQNGVTSGKLDGSFDPNGEITRAEFAIMLHRAMQLATTSYSVDVQDGLTQFSKIISVTVNTDTPANFQVVFNGDVTLPYSETAGAFVASVDTSMSIEDIEANIEVTNLAGLLQTIEVQDGLTQFSKIVSVKLNSEDTSHEVSVDGTVLAYQESSASWVGSVDTTKSTEELEALVMVNGVLQTGATQPSKTDSNTDTGSEEPTTEEPTVTAGYEVVSIDKKAITAWDSLVKVKVTEENPELYTVTVLGETASYKDGVFSAVVMSTDEAEIKAGIVVEKK